MPAKVLKCGEKVFNKLLEFNHSFFAFNKTFRLSRQLYDTAMWLLKAMSGIENYTASIVF